MAITHNENPHAPSNGYTRTPLSVVNGTATHANEGERPMPLFRPASEPHRFPVEALGVVLGDACRAIRDIVQAPDGLAAQSVLAASALAVQAHVDVVLPATNHAVPTSLFLVSVAASGERKSAADREASKAITDWQRERYDLWKVEKEQHDRDRTAYDSAKKAAERGKDYDAIRAAIDALPAPPIAPLTPILTTSEPTLEGLLKLVQTGQPAVGIFADEGGSFLGGHGMSSENRLRTVTGLSDMWGGRPINRVRSGDGASIVLGKRLSMHVMLQPGLASTLLADEMFRDQGFLSRLLVSAPRSTMGTRMQRKPALASYANLKRYSDRVSAILYHDKPLRDGSRNELDPRHLHFSADAGERWRQYADDVELQLAAGEKYQPIAGLANKLPEHAARIAAVLECVEDIDAAEISLDALERAILLAGYYGEEALRLFGIAAPSPEFAVAEKVRQWLNSPSWRDEHISVRALTQFGPSAIRESKTAEQAIEVLAAHRYLVPTSGTVTIRGDRARKAWRIVREADHAGH